MDETAVARVVRRVEQRGAVTIGGVVMLRGVKDLCET